MLPFCFAYSLHFLCSSSGSLVFAHLGSIYLIVMSALCNVTPYFYYSASLLLCIYLSLSLFLCLTLISIISKCVYLCFYGLHYSKAIMVIQSYNFHTNHKILLSYNLLQKQELSSNCFPFTNNVFTTILLTSFISKYLFIFKRQHNTILLLI